MASGDVTPFLLAEPMFLGSTSTAITAPTASYTTYTIKQIVLCNTDGVERWVKLGVDGISAANCFVYQLPIAAYDTVVLDTALTLTYLSSSLYGAADTADKVTVTVTGWRTAA